MATQLTFSDEFVYDDSPYGITIPVMLSYGATDILASAKVDTGAQVCLFSHEDGLKLGIPIEQGLYAVLDGLGGSVEAFGHEVTIQAGELAFHSLAFFAKYPGLSRNILGRQGWLRNLRMAVIDYDNLLSLSSYDS
ncbi:MAG: retropepsin-like domain-containing protein [Chloracidobacterium sp.]|nr:retropepsin-like domain-containing protein [Chloracidobacterium sp.]